MIKKVQKSWGGNRSTVSSFLCFVLNIILWQTKICWNHYRKNNKVIDNKPIMEIKWNKNK